MKAKKSIISLSVSLTLTLSVSSQCPRDTTDRKSNSFSPAAGRARCAVGSRGGVNVCGCFHTSCAAGGGLTVARDPEPSACGAGGCIVAVCTASTADADTCCDAGSSTPLGACGLVSCAVVAAAESVPAAFGAIAKGAVGCGMAVAIWSFARDAGNSSPCWGCVAIEAGAPSACGNPTTVE